MSDSDAWVGDAVQALRQTRGDQPGRTGRNLEVAARRHIRQCCASELLRYASGKMEAEGGRKSVDIQPHADYNCCGRTTSGEYWNR